MKLSEFSARKKLTERLALNTQDGEQWVEFQTTDTKDFANAQAAFSQAITAKAMAGESMITTKEVLGEKLTERSESYNKLFAIQMSSLIIDWSFEDELTQESAAMMLYQNPSVLNELDARAAALLSASNAKKKPQSKQQKAKLN